MAALHFTSSPSLTLPNHNGSPLGVCPTQFLAGRANPKVPVLRAAKNYPMSCAVRAYKVVVEQEGQSTELEVEPDETILEKALDSGLSVPHDCKLGVCMTCPARLLTGEVDQSDGMLSDDVVENGYTLLCVSYPKSDCRVRIIPEDELLSLQLATAND